VRGYLDEHPNASEKEAIGESNAMRASYYAAKRILSGKPATLAEERALSGVASDKEAFECDDADLFRRIASEPGIVQLVEDPTPGPQDALREIIAWLGHVDPDERARILASAAVFYGIKGAFFMLDLVGGREECSKP
jgi:hypothetical protein